MMRYLTAFFLLFSGLHLLSAQSVAELEARFNRSSSKTERLNYAFQIAEKSLAANNAKKASDFAMRANQLAVEVGDKRREADAAVLAADAEFRLRNYKEAAGRFNRAWNTARNYGFRDLVLISSEKLQDISMKQNDLKEALKWSTETVKYLKESGGGVRGGGESLRRLENQLAAAEADNRSLREQLAAATGKTEVLQNTYQSQLKEVEEKTQLVLSEKDAALSQASQTALKADSAAKVYSLRVKNLTEDQMIDSIVKAQQEREIQEKKTRLAEAELLREQSENMRNVLALVVVFVLFLAVLFYARFRAKKRMANELSQKNALIEEEQKRSNSLLLNILPPAIAEELKARNKVAARKYDQATVMFIDFKGFTNVAEQLSPERLVEELDLCFSNFDQIISKYRIEKIKTVGDAYICASGLSDMNASPSDIVKAALEMQDFLLGLKAERMSQGLPYFDARVGIHTGPVVAGVVGAKKFAYDIWGDTVNTAARLEEQCEPGRVNVSEDAFWLAKYEFEWLHRGKIPAKNKGMMDMYYVTGIKQY